MDDVNAIHAKYNFGDNKSSALGHERGVPPLSLEQLAAQVAAEDSTEDSTEVAAEESTEVEAPSIAIGAIALRTIPPSLIGP